MVAPRCVFEAHVPHLCASVQIASAHHVAPCAELYCYLRSPYRDLSAYDRIVQVREYHVTASHGCPMFMATCSTMCRLTYHHLMHRSTVDGGIHGHRLARVHTHAHGMTQLDAPPYPTPEDRRCRVLRLGIVPIARELRLHLPRAEERIMRELGLAAQA